MSTDDRKIWELTLVEYQGDAKPHIMEISPYQYQKMGKQQQAAYDKKRNAEWDKAAQIGGGYKRAILQAWKDGEFTLFDPGVIEADKRKGPFGVSARDIVQQELSDETKRVEEARFASLTEQNSLEADPATVGDYCYSIGTGNYGRITKINTITLEIITKTGSVSAPLKIGSCAWLHYNELKKLANSAANITPKRYAQLYGTTDLNIKMPSSKARDTGYSIRKKDGKFVVRHMSGWACKFDKKSRAQELVNFLDANYPELKNWTFFTEGARLYGLGPMLAWAAKTGNFEPPLAGASKQVIFGITGSKVEPKEPRTEVPARFLADLAYNAYLEGHDKRAEWLQRNFEWCRKETEKALKARWTEGNKEWRRKGLEKLQGEKA